MSTPLLLGLLALGGSVVGALLNVVIVRVPLREPITSDLSRCRSCGRPSSWAAWVPLRILGRRSCAHCGGEKPVGHIVIEVANALLWVIAGLRFGMSAELAPYCALFSVLLALSAIDAQLSILPNRITYPAAVVSFVAVIPLAWMHHDPVSKLAGAWLSGLGYAGFLWLLMTVWALFLGRDGMGAGDVKLAPTLGIWLGYLHPFLALLGVLAASVLGTVAGALILLIRRRNEAFPFGPWLALGAVMVIIASEPLLRLNGFT